MICKTFTAASAGIALSFALGGAAGAATFTVVALEGEAAPGAGGAVFSLLGTPALLDLGVAAFSASVAGDGITFENGGRGVFTSTALVARSGDVAPGSDGATFLNVGAPAINNAGVVAFNASLNGVDEATDTGFFTIDALLVRKGDPAPGLPGVTFASLATTAALNEAGEIAFTAGLAGNGVVAASNEGVFTSTALVARKGSPAPEFGGATFLAVSRPDLNDSGAVAHRGRTDAIANDLGFFVDGALVVREGDAAPGAAGASLDSLLGPSLNNSGEIAFRAGLTGFDVEAANDEGLFTSQALIARKGDAAPGIDGAVFSSLLSPALNDAGQAGFRAGVTGPGVDLTNNVGLFRWDGFGGIELVVRLGDMIDIGGGALRTITALDFLPQGFNNKGQFAFHAEFLDGQAADGSLIFRSGIFVSDVDDRTPAVPLPPALALMLTGLAALGVMGRRGRRAS